MNIHKNARLTPLRREEMALSVLEDRLSKAEAAQTYGVSAKIVARWVERFKAAGRAGMADRSSRPALSPNATGAIAGDAMSDAVETAEFLDVDMDQFARMSALIAADNRKTASRRSASIDTQRRARKQ